MTAHLTLPYNWTDCVKPENCQEYIHVQEKAHTLNTYPKKWVQALIPDECANNQGTITLYNHNKEIHSDNGPAIEHADGELEWYKEGKLHREDGPVSEWEGGEAWYLFGERHREDGPAFTGSDSNGKLEQWWIHGKRHREDGPSEETSAGYKAWYLNGEPHRENGPAVETPEGKKFGTSTGSYTEKTDQP